MDSFDVKLLEILTKMRQSPSPNEDLNPIITDEVRNRIRKILDKYFIFVSRDTRDTESEDSWQRPPYMYAIVNGKVRTALYSSNFEGMYMVDELIKISWDKLYRTQNEAIDSIISKRRRKPL